MAVKIKSTKTLKIKSGGYNEYIKLSGVTGKTNIKSLEKKYKGEFRLIGGDPVIVRFKK